MNKMIAALFAIILLSACGDDKKRSLTESAIHAKVDSMVGAKMEDMNKQAMDDLDNRMAIEVKAKADSIVAARTGHLDTTHHAVSRQVLPQPMFHKKI